MLLIIRNKSKLINFKFLNLHHPFGLCQAALLLLHNIYFFVEKFTRHSLLSTFRTLSLYWFAHLSFMLEMFADSFDSFSLLIL